MAQLDVGAGIKLFGATITLQQQQGCYNKTNSKDDDDDDVVGSEQESQPKRRMQEQESQRERVIACPRCKSMETKFCYFNNYNVNQPRHFCKGCQRYWTAGGALRNVPVGAGRRKVKPPGREDGEGGCLYDVAGFELWEGWGVAAVEAGFRRIIPAKRRRSDSDSGGQQSSC